MVTLAGWNELTRELDSVSNKTLALENYSKILAGANTPSQVFDDLLRVSLESIDLDIDIKEGSKVTLRALKDGVKAAGKYIWKLILKLLEYVRSFYIKFTGSIARVRKTHAAMSRKLSRLGSAVVNTGVLVKGVERLSVDGAFVGTSLNNLTNIKEMADYIINTHPKFVVDYSRKVSREFLNLMDKPKSTPAETNLALISTVTDAYRALFKVPGAVTSTEQEGITFNRSTVLPGNRALLYTDVNSLADQVNKGIDAAVFINESMSIRFTEISLNVPDNSEKEIKVPSVRELKKLSDAISDILNIAENATKGVKDYEQIRTVVNDAVRQINESEADDRIRSTALIMLGQMSKKLAEPVGNFTHWLAITLNVYVNLMNLFIEHYNIEGN